MVLLVNLSIMKNRKGRLALNFGGNDLFGNAAPTKNINFKTNV